MDVFGEFKIRRKCKDVSRLWADGRAYEIEFWRSYIATGGREWPDDFRRRLDPKTPLQDNLKTALRGFISDRVHILDVGAGPLTTLGKSWPGVDLRITAVDPLADEYRKILDEFGVAAPVTTRRGFAEKLNDLFQQDAFDAVYCRNALDHSINPVLGIKQMLRVVRPGRPVMLEHASNEGAAENYVGFHQWNFACQNGNFVIWRPEIRIDVQRYVKNIRRVETHEKNGWVNVTLWKNS